MTYEAFYKCANCFYICVVRYPKETVAENLLNCPNCGCDYLEKTKKTDNHEFATYCNTSQIKASK
jgi:DNA-directed RNA polymerase subunit RPC12/RpoP